MVAIMVSGAIIQKSQRPDRKQSFSAGPRSIQGVIRALTVPSAIDRNAPSAADAPLKMTLVWIRRSAA